MEVIDAVSNNYQDLENNISKSSNLLYLHQLSNTVRSLACLDLILGIFMFFYGYIGVYIVIRLLCSLSGYYGSLYYSSFYTFIYLIFLILCTITEGVFIYYYINLYHDKQISYDLLVGGIIYQIFFVFLKIYITRFVCIFNSYIYDLTELDKKELIEFNGKAVKIIIW